MIEMHVDGMTCGGCVKRVTQAIQKVDAQADVRVDLASKKVTVTGEAGRDAYEAAVRQAGYTPRSD